ncbi:MAG: hypothetical protein Q8J78_09265 [Moraxellaceae bacterium]|nr:hypothetical protein [Moraxellaceae bacterium]
MNQIVKHMGNISIPQEMLDQVDMNTLLNDFARDFNSLDDIKKARERHESRNALSRWWNKDELEKAQLDSVQLQARYAKSIGQLIVISVAQSATLNEQQRIMGEQQTHIKKQADSIQKANETIYAQQEQLAKQQTDLEKLIKDYFLLKGLTTNEAKRLIAIANEVKQTKEDILSRFEATSTQVENSISSNRRTENKVSVLSEKLTSLSDSLNTHNLNLSGLRGTMQRESTALDTRLTTHINQVSAISERHIADIKSECMAQLAIQLRYIKALAIGLGASTLGLFVHHYFWQ